MKDNIWKLYRHTSPSGWVYIGITKEHYPEFRWKRGSGYAHNPHFTNAIRKYGWDNFQHEILIEELDFELAKQMEILFIAEARKIGKCYNITDGGDGHNGQPLTAETRSKISKTLKSKHTIPWNKGKTGVYSEETLKIMSEKSKGRPAWSKGKKLGPQSEEHRKKISEANKGKKKPDQKGKRKPYTEEHRKHISEGLKSKRLGVPLGPRPEDVKDKISKGRLGQKWVCKPWMQPKQISKDLVESYLNEGWMLGKIICIDDKRYKWNKTDKIWILI